MLLLHQHCTYYCWNYEWNWTFRESEQSTIIKWYNFLKTLKSTSVSVCFRGISRLPSAFVFLRWFKVVHISIQVCTFHDGCKQGFDQQILIRNQFHVKLRILSPENCNQSLQVKSWKAEVTAEKKQTQDYNKNFVTQAHKS